MKKKLFFATLFIGAIVFNSCQKEEMNSSDNSNLNRMSENEAVNAIINKFDINIYNELVSNNEARLALLEDQASRGLMKSISVPKDYATIQEAVDAASEGANIFVNSGTYTEDVAISTAGLKLQARNNVQLIGSFTLFPGADNVTIKKFSINNPNPFGTAIHAFGISGGQIVQNTITAEPGNNFVQEGMHLISCDGVTVRDNVVTGPDWALIFNSFSLLGNGSSNNNTISNNSMSNNYAVGIHLQGNTQHNTVSNNTVSEGSEDGNGGIWIYGIPDYIGAPIEFQGECNNNIVKNNNCTQGWVGIGLIFNAYNNTIGPNNSTNENNKYGIFLYSGPSDNLIFNNTTLDNGMCDIVVIDGDFPPFAPNVDNTLRNNTFDCFAEVW